VVIQESSFCESSKAENPKFIHAKALESNSIPQRVTGMKATFGAIAVASVANLSSFLHW
jgi:uncharacterized membrane protein YecN with MAPEG domain